MAGARSLTVADFDPSSARFWIKYLSTLRAIDYNRPEFRMAGTRSLRELLQTVPQEMYDRIYDYTFTTTTNALVKVDKQTRPPAIMQVDRATRAKVAVMYYSNTFDFVNRRLRHDWTHGMGLVYHGSVWESGDDQDESTTGLLQRYEYSWFKRILMDEYVLQLNGDIVKVRGSVSDRITGWPRVLSCFRS